MAKIVALVPDLMFGTRIEDAAKHLGYPVEFVKPEEDAGAMIAHVSPALVVVALDAPHSMEAIEAGRKAGARVLAFGSHKNVELMRAAKAAGCDQVVARSQMAADLPNLLKKYAE
jgi:hypothetical protein